MGLNKEHKDVTPDFFRQENIDTIREVYKKCFDSNFQLSRHAKNMLNRLSRKGITKLTMPTPKNFQIMSVFEINREIPNSPKIAFRFAAGISALDVCFVISRYGVITVWINHMKDTHTQLIKTNYKGH